MAAVYLMVPFHFSKHTCSALLFFSDYKMQYFLYLFFWRDWEP